MEGMVLVVSGYAWQGAGCGTPVEGFPGRLPGVPATGPVVVPAGSASVLTDLAPGITLGSFPADFFARNYFTPLPT